MGLEDLHRLAGDHGPPHSADQLFGFAREHDHGDDLNPAGGGAMEQRLDSSAQGSAVREVARRQVSSGRKLRASSLRPLRRLATWSKSVRGLATGWGGVSGKWRYLAVSGGGAYDNAGLMRVFGRPPAKGADSQGFFRILSSYKETAVNKAELTAAL